MNKNKMFNILFDIILFLINITLLSLLFTNSDQINLDYLKYGLFLNIIFLIINFFVKRRMEMLRKNIKNQIDFILNNSAEGYILLDKNNKVIKINNKARKILNFDEIINKSFFSFFDDNTKEKISEVFFNKKEELGNVFVENGKGEKYYIIMRFSFNYIYDCGCKGCFIRILDNTKVEDLTARLNQNERLIKEQVDIKTEKLNKTLLKEENVKKILENSLSQLEKDEAAGKKLQFQMLPRTPEYIGEYTFYNVFLPSAKLSGDFLDYFKINDNLTGFYVADVSGHGISSALVTIRLKGYFDNMLKNYKEENNNTICKPDRLLEDLNRSIIRDHIEKHITIFYGVIDNRKKRLIFSNAGQFPYPVIVANGKADFIVEKGMPIGLMEQSFYKSRFLNITNDFFMVVFSDGILEILPEKNIKQQEDYLKELIKNRDFDVSDLVSHSTVKNFKNLPDDITILMIRREEF